MVTFSGYEYTDGHSYSMALHATTLVSPHFRVSEFACNDGSDEVLIHHALPWLLEAIREIIGNRPLSISSGYRTPHYNDHVIGGATRSRHKTGQAADITCRYVSRRALYRAAKRLNPGGLGAYRTFTHVDIQGVGRRWGKMRYRA